MKTQELTSSMLIHFCDVTLSDSKFLSSMYRMFPMMNFDTPKISQVRQSPACENKRPVICVSENRFINSPAYQNS